MDSGSNCRPYDFNGDQVCDCPDCDRDFAEDERARGIEKLKKKLASV